jgi:cytochrome c551/c552
MFRSHRRRLPAGLARCACALFACLAAAAPAEVRERHFGFGKAATASEIAGWDIDVRADGSGLPEGRGSVEQGQSIYDARCASCHGTFGESNSYLQLAGGVGTLNSDQPIRTTGSKLNYAPTLWDYIRRAMPLAAPQTLTHDQVYALTAYVLYLNDIVPTGTTLDRATLPRVRMPNRDGFTTEHGFLARDGKPDTANVACMSDCAAAVRLASEIPDHARDSHGKLAEQQRKRTALAAALGTSVAAADRSSTVGGIELARRAGCMACHNLTTAIVGPAFRDVAQRYRTARAGEQAQQELLVKIRNGGAGAWGAVPMPPQSQLSESDARAVVEWILAGAK